MLLIFMAEFRRHVAAIRRYPLEPVTTVLVLLVFFLTIFYGLRPSQSALVEHERTTINAVLGYVFWLFVVIALSNFSTKLEDEAKLGTLEQVCLTSRGLFRVCIARLLVDLVFGLIQTSILVTLLLWATDLQMTVPAPALIPAALTIAAIYGFGFMLGGVSLLFRRTGELRALCQMLFLALAIVPLASLPPALQYVALLLPLNLGLEAVRSITGNPDAAWRLLMRDVLPVGGLAAAYCTAGYVIFTAAHRMARMRGLLARY